MRKRLKALTARIEEAADALRAGYQPDELYRLRVGIRRLRSLLKCHGKRRRRFRKTWRAFQSVTGSARDWDVFVTTAAELLTPEELRDFESANQARIRSSRTAVMHMLGSNRWRTHMTVWNAYLQRPRGSRERRRKPTLPVEPALIDAGAALASALSVNDDRTWHKLRIAIKELRYVADEAMDRPGADPGFAQVVETCKALQTLLGDWHDTVVQLDLLRELEPLPVHRHLEARILERKRECLSRAREKLAGQSVIVTE
jgi:CHAD domain-containing protein